MKEISKEYSHIPRVTFTAPEMYGWPGITNPDYWYSNKIPNVTISAFLGSVVSLFDDAGIPARRKRRLSNYLSTRVASVKIAQNARKVSRQNYCRIGEASDARTPCRYHYSALCESFENCFGAEFSDDELNVILSCDEDFAFPEV